MTVHLFYLSHKLVRVCEIGLSHMGTGTNNRNQDLVCENISVLITFLNLYLFKATTCVDKRV